MLVGAVAKLSMKEESVERLEAAMREWDAPGWFEVERERQKYVITEEGNDH